MAKSSFKVVILGAGAGGISVAAKLRRQLGEDEIAVVDPSESHFYQPLWTIVGAGLMKKEVTKKPQAQVIPAGVTWIKESVEEIDPNKNLIRLSHGLTLSYEYLVVATGLQLDWGKIKGLEGHLGKNGICSVYQYDQVDAVAEMIQKFQGGKAIFVMPPTPIKCAGAPQKIMYLADHVFRNNGIRHKTSIQFATAGKAMFGIPVFSNASFFNIPVVVKTRKTVQSDGSVRVELTLSKELAEQIERAQALLSHAVPCADLVDYLDYVTKRVIQQKTSVRKNKVTTTMVVDPNTDQEIRPKQGKHAPVEMKSPEMGSSSTTTVVVKRFSPRQKKIVLNQNSRCMHKDHNTGQVCGGRWFLQVDHRQSLWAGGTNDLQNAQVLCAHHNQEKYKKESRVRLI